MRFFTASIAAFLFLLSKYGRPPPKSERGAVRCGRAWGPMAPYNELEWGSFYVVSKE